MSEECQTRAKRKALRASFALKIRKNGAGFAGYTCLSNKNRFVGKKKLTWRLKNLNPYLSGRKLETKLNRFFYSTRHFLKIKNFSCPYSSGKQMACS